MVCTDFVLLESQSWPLTLEAPNLLRNPTSKGFLDVLHKFLQARSLCYWEWFIYLKNVTVRYPMSEKMSIRNSEIRRHMSHCNLNPPWTLTPPTGIFDYPKWIINSDWVFFRWSKQPHLPSCSDCWPPMPELLRVQTTTWRWWFFETKGQRSKKVHSFRMDFQLKIASCDKELATVVRRNSWNHH